jgi:hypothetical protein
MPRFDGTGPQGKGSMTGRGMGRCTPQNTDPQNTTPQNVQDANQNNVPIAPTNRFFGWFRNGFGRGNGQGLGRGRNQGTGRGLGRGRGFWNNN